MLEKCSNPECDLPFDYREGRLVRFSPADTKPSEPFHCVEHFWLCGKCSERYVFAHERGAGMKIRLHPAAMRAIEEIKSLYSDFVRHEPKKQINEKIFHDD